MTNTHTEDSRLAEAGVPEPLRSLLFEARYDLRSKRETLIEQASRLADDMTNVAAKVKDNFHVNTLGEVQGQGSRVDIACAEYEAAVSNLKRAIYLIDRLNGIEVSFEEGEVSVR